MKGVSSVEVLLLAVILLAGITLMGKQVTATLSIGKSLDPMLMTKAAGIKLLSTSLEVNECNECVAKIRIYVPPQSSLSVKGGVLKAMALGETVLEANTPIIIDINIVGEVRADLSVSKVSGGVEIS